MDNCLTTIYDITTLKEEGEGMGVWVGSIRKLNLNLQKKINWKYLKCKHQEILARSSLLLRNGD